MWTEEQKGTEFQGGTLILTFTELLFSCCFQEEKIKQTTFQDYSYKIAEAELKSRPI